MADKDFILNVWVPALRSGKYQQGIGYLRTQKDTYCCLGVACDILGVYEWVPDPESPVYALHTNQSDTWYTEFLPPEVQNRIGLTDEEQDLLMRLNDDFRCSFEEIADFLEGVRHNDSGTLPNPVKV